MQNCNLSELPKGELAILQLIATRLFVAVGEPYRYAETVVEVSCCDTLFSAKGKNVLQEGWKGIEGKRNATKREEENVLPSVSVGDELTVTVSEVKEGKTSPPKHYTEVICYERGIRNRP